MERERKRESANVSRRKRESYALVPCTSLRIHVTKRESARSFDPDDPYPAAENKILHNPDISRIGLHFATLSLKARTTGPPASLSRIYETKKKKNKRRACTRVHMFEVRSLRSVHERMVWGMVELCDILQDCHTTFSLRHARAPEKAFPSTTGELFRLSNRSFRSPFSFSLDKKKLALA